VVGTTDGGTWSDIGGRLPPAQPGEGAFAASGTCTAALEERYGWIATGAAARARVLRTTDRGDSWSEAATPIAQGGQTRGAATIAFRDTLHGLLAGGDIAAPDAPADNVAVTRDGGRTWTLTTRTPFPGAVYGLAYVPAGDGRTVVATGPSGAAWSADEGRTWRPLEGARDYWAVGATGPGKGTGWLVGTEGRILKLSF
jgi:photosystem II stability/assembly factor-like uncharacterized protein